MAEQRPPHVTGHHPIHIVPPHIVPLTAPAARQTTVANRSGVTVPAPHPSVYEPWTALLAKADARFKTEITAAVRDLEAATSVAGRLLDTSAATAAEAAASLEAAAWAAFGKYMAAADATRNEILDRARAAYAEQIELAAGQYDRSLASAEQVYKTIVDDARRAQADAKSIVTNLPA